MFKKLFVLYLILAIAISMVACDQSTSNDFSNEGNTTNESNNTNNNSNNSNHNSNTSNNSNSNNSNNNNSSNTTNDQSQTHSHSFGSIWKTNDSYHWYECSCGSKSDDAAHTFGEWNVTQEASIAYEGSKERVCSVCQFKETATISKLETSYNQNSNQTSIYNGITVTKLPYTSNGVTINSINFSGTKVSIEVTNSTGYAITDLSHIPYKCYNSSGTVLKTGNVYLEDLNNGESCIVYFHAESGTTKILFEEASVRQGTATDTGDTAVYNGITVTKLPYTSNGVTINSINFSGTKVSIEVTNSKGYAITDLSHIPYKCYNSRGTVLKTGNVYLEDLNNGESCIVYFHAESGTTKIIFGESSVRKS